MMGETEGQPTFYYKSGNSFPRITRYGLSDR